MDGYGAQAAGSGPLWLGVGLAMLAVCLVVVLATHAAEGVRRWRRRR